VKQLRVVETEQDIIDIKAMLLACLTFSKKHVCEIKPYVKSRTLPQNSISHIWYSNVATKEGEYTATEVKRLCKLHIGLNILRGADKEYNDKCAMFIDPLPYGHKLLAMDFFPVTSFFDSEQFNTYLDGMRKNYAGRVDLRFPEETPLKDL
jgi:hypothetical protein